MCKIILKIGPKLTKAEIEAHRERNEDGAGVVGISSDNFFSIKDMKHEKMYELLGEDKKVSPFWLFHSRMPSSGPVVAKNIQPFTAKKMAFCHNGTVKKEELILHVAMKGEFLDGNESDSNLLFKYLTHCDSLTARSILHLYDTQNFVMISNVLREIYVCGKFKLEFRQKKLYMAKNDYSEDKVKIVCSFTGEIRSMEREKPTYVTYPVTHCGGSSNYGGRNWGRGDFFQGEGEDYSDDFRDTKYVGYEREKQLIVGEEDKQNPGWIWNGKLLVKKGSPLDKWTKAEEEKDADDLAAATDGIIDLKKIGHKPGSKWTDEELIKIDDMMIEYFHDKLKEDVPITDLYFPDRLVIKFPDRYRMDRSEVVPK